MSDQKCIRLAALSVLLASSGVFAASATWTGGDTGGTPTAFNDGLNWSTGTQPGNAPDVATFSAANNGTSITLPATVGTLNAGSFSSVGGPNLVFDATAASYTFGTTANANTYVISASGAFLSTTSGAASQTFYQAFALGNRTGAPAFSITNGTAASNLTFNGNITSQSNQASAQWVVSSNGAGTKTYNGVIGDVTPSTNVGLGLLLKISTGTTVLNNANTYFGGTQLTGGGGSTVLGNKAGFGTGAVAITASNNTVSSSLDLSGGNAVTNAVNFINNGSYTLTIGGSQNLELAGPVNLASNAGTAYSANAAQTFNVTNSALTTISGVVSGNPTTFQSGLTKTGGGVLVLTNANTYGGGSQGTIVNGGTLLINNTSGSGTGSSGVTNVNTGGTFGGNGITSGLIAVNTGGTFSPGPSAGATGIFTSTSTGNSALVLNTGSTTLFDIAGTTKGTGYDNVTDTNASTGKVSYGGDLKINFTSLPGSNTVYDLFSFALVNATSFNTISLTGLVTGSLTNGTGAGAGTWTGSYGGNNYSFAQSTGDLTVTVPEPASLAIIGLGAVLGLRRRRA